MKQLIDYFDANENDFLLGIIYLDEFYKDLKQYNNSKIIINNKNDCGKKEGITNINISNKNNDIKKKKSKIEGRNYNEDKQLPLLLNNKLKNFLTKNDNITNSDNSNENISNYEDDKKLFKAHKSNNDNKHLINKDIFNLNKKSFLNKTENKNKTIKIENNTDVNHINIMNRNKHYKYDKAISLCNTNEHTNTSHNTTIQRKMTKGYISTDKKLSNKNIMNKQEINIQNQHINKIINKRNINKINTLFDELKLEINSSSDNSKKSKRKFSKESENGENESHKKLSRIGEESNCSLRKTNQSKKEKSKKKKRGNKIYDFII